MFLARRLGIAPATLRTWDRRYGRGPSEHSAGSHRRYSPSDIARLEHMEEGSLPLQTLRAHIDFVRATAHTTYGTVGIKVWIYKGEVFGDEQKSN